MAETGGRISPNPGGWVGGLKTVFGTRKTDGSRKIGHEKKMKLFLHFFFLSLEEAGLCIQTK